MKEELFGNRQKQSFFVLILMIAGIIYTVSRQNAQKTPEGIVKAAVEEMVEAAQKKKIAPFKEHLSEQVRDDSDHGKEEMLNMMRGIFLRHPKISLQIFALDVKTGTNPNVISVSLTLLMSEGPLPTDKGTFDITFRNENGQWRVWEVAWRDGYGS